VHVINFCSSVLLPLVIDRKTKEDTVHKEFAFNYDWRWSESS